MLKNDKGEVIVISARFCVHFESRDVRCKRAFPAMRPSFYYTIEVTRAMHIN